LKLFKRRKKSLSGTLSFFFKFNFLFRALAFGYGDSMFLLFEFKGSKFESKAIAKTSLESSNLYLEASSTKTSKFTSGIS